MSGNGVHPAGPIDRVFENAVVPATPHGGKLAWGMTRLVVPAPLLAERDADPLTLDEFSNLRIGPPLGGALLPAARNRSEYVRSDKDVDFIGAAALNNQVTANLAGLSRNFGMVESVTLLAQQNLDWEIVFWTRNTFSNADMDLDRFLDSVVFNAADGMTIANGVPATFRYAVSGLGIAYQDQDVTNTLHVGLIPRNGAKLAAGAGGFVVLLFGFRADAP